MHGIGDATLNGRELAVAAYLSEHVIPCLLGRDAHQIEDVWQFLYRGAYWRRGPVTMAAIAAVDTALWDLKAKAAGLPLYQLLGGREPHGRAGLRSCQRPRHRRDRGRGRALHRAGLPGDPRAMRACRGSTSTYGVSGDKMFYEPADANLPSENVWSTEKYLAHVPKLFEALRARFGAEPHLLHDVHHRLTPIEAARLGKALEPFRLFWMEDATPAENQANFRLIRQHTVTPLAVGEVFNTIWDCKQLVEEQLIDYIRTTVVHAGGITHLRRIADFAGAAQRAHGLPRRDRSVAGLHGRVAAPEHRDPQLRHPGIHAAHGRDGRRVPARLPVRGRPAARGRDAGPRRRHRRGAGRAISRIGAPTCPSIASRTARSGTGEAAAGPEESAAPHQGCGAAPARAIAAPVGGLLEPEADLGAVGARVRPKADAAQAEVLLRAGVVLLVETRSPTYSVIDARSHSNPPRRFDNVERRHLVRELVVADDPDQAPGSATGRASAGWSAPRCPSTGCRDACTPRAARPRSSRSSQRYSPNALAVSSGAFGISSPIAVTLNPPVIWMQVAMERVVVARRLIRDLCVEIADRAANGEVVGHRREQLDLGALPFGIDVDRLLEVRRQVAGRQEPEGLDLQVRPSP